jgi:hypothetical protein
VAAAENRRLGMVFGLVGALFLLLEGLVDLVSGVVFVSLGHGYRALGAVQESFILIAIGLLIGIFSVFGRTRGEDRALASGVVLIVLVVVGWFALGFSSGVLAILGSVFVLLGGFFFLIATR